MAFEIHAHQWLIAPTPIPMVNRFQCVSLEDGLVLHHHPALSVARVRSENRDLVILGHFVGSPRHSAEMHYVPGRFVVIDFPWLSLDATGSIGVFYFKQSARRPEVVCSSSLALVCQLTGLPLSSRPLLSKSTDLNWEPPPWGSMAGLRTLYCDQALNLVTGEVEQRPRELAAQHLSEQAAADQLAFELTQTAKRLGQLNRPLVLLLTAGRDSRTLFASLLAAGVQFEARTLVFPHDPRSRIDAKTAAFLCKKIGIRHNVVCAEAVRRERIYAYEIHTAGRGMEGARTIGGNVYRNLPLDAMLVRGLVFEVGRRFFAKRLPAIPFSSRDAAITIGRALRDEDRRAIAALRSWYRYRLANPIAGMDFVDLFYLDQRCGGWNAASLQGEDLVSASGTMPANSWRCVELLLSAPIERRDQAPVQMRALEVMAPGLIALAPINKVSLATLVQRRFRSRLRWYSRRLQRLLGLSLQRRG